MDVSEEGPGKESGENAELMNRLSERAELLSALGWTFIVVGMVSLVLLLAIGPLALGIAIILLIIGASFCHTARKDEDLITQSYQRHLTREKARKTQAKRQLNFREEHKTSSKLRIPGPEEEKEEEGSRPRYRKLEEPASLTGVTAKAEEGSEVDDIWKDFQDAAPQSPAPKPRTAEGQAPKEESEIFQPPVSEEGGLGKKEPETLEPGEQEYGGGREETLEQTPEPGQKDQETSEPQEPDQKAAGESPGFYPVSPGKNTGVLADIQDEQEIINSLLGKQEGNKKNQGPF